MYFIGRKKNSLRGKLLKMHGNRELKAVQSFP